MKSQENKNLIKEIAKIKIYNEWFGDRSSVKKFLLSEASGIPISWVDDIGRNLRNVIDQLKDVQLEKVLDDLKQFANRPDNVESLKRSFTSLNDAQLTAAVKSLMSQNIPEVNDFVTEVISRKLTLQSREDLNNIFKTLYLDVYPDRKLQENIDEFFKYSNIDRQPTEFQDAVRNSLTREFKPKVEDILNKSQIKSLAKAVNIKGGKSFMIDVFKAIYTETKTLIQDIEKLSEEFVVKLIEAEGNEQRKQVQEAYALAISRKLNQIYMKGDKVGKDEFSKLSLPEEFNRLILYGDQDIFKIFRELRNVDPGFRAGLKAATESLPSDSKFIDFSGKGSEGLSKLFGEKIGSLAKIRFNESARAFLVSGQWATKSDIYRKAIQMQGIKDPKRAAAYLTVLLLKSGLGTIIANVILSSLSAIAYTSGLKDLVNKFYEKMGRDPIYDTKKYSEGRKEDKFALPSIIDAAIIDFLENMQGISFAIPYWNTMGRAPLNVMLGIIVGKHYGSLWGGPDIWGQWLWKEAAKAANIPEEDIEKIEKDAKKIEKDEFVIPEDLKLTLSGDLQFLQDRVYMLDNGLFAIAFQKGKESKDDVELVKPSGVWEVVHFTDSSQTNTTSTPLTDEDFREYLKNYFKPPVTESIRKNKIIEQLIYPPKQKEENSTGEELDKKVEELKKEVQSVKDSETFRKALEELNKFAENVKNTSVDLAEKAKVQYDLWVLRKKLEEKKPTSDPQKVRDNLTNKFTPCTGFNQLGCNSESIKQIQQCLNLPNTGNFDKQLYNELGSYGWQNGFNDSDVNRICDLIKRTLEANIQIQKQKKEAEDFYRKFPKTSRGSEILDLS